MKIGILGAGAMGSLVGAHLKKGGGTVCFIDVFEEHMRAIRENGLIMELENESEPQTVFLDSAVTSGKEVGECDIVVVLVKGVDIEAAVKSNMELFGNDTIVITLQNGVGSADVLADYFDRGRLGIGILKSSANIIAPGRIIGRPCFMDSPKGMYFSPIDPNTSYRSVYEEFEKLCCDGGMPAECSERTVEYIWDKLCSNVMMNGIAALLQIACEDIDSHEDGWQVMKELCRETCAVARAKGINLDFDNYWSDKSGKPPFDRSSVKTFHFVSAVFDSYQKRRTEIDFLNGAVVKEGRKHGIPTPYNETIWRLVRLMQDTYDFKYKPRIS